MKINFTTHKLITYDEKMSTIMTELKCLKFFVSIRESTFLKTNLNEQVKLVK